MVIDIVCDKSVDPNYAVKTTYGDRPYYFCSKKCEMDFVGNPLRYVDKSQSASSLEGTSVVSSAGDKEPFSKDSYQ